MASAGSETKLTEDGARRALKALMEEGPLYGRLTFDGGVPCRFPELLFLECKGCGGPQNWQRVRPSEWPDPRKARLVPEPTDRDTRVLVVYKCRNCNRSEARFAMSWVRNGTENHITKFGQSPPLVDRVPASLNGVLDAGTQELYVKALRCRNFGFGLGALAYLRRTVEGRVNEIIDSVAEAARHSPGCEELLSQVEKVKSTWQFEKKVKFAADLVPAHLKPGGRNPLDALHDLASKGIHHLGEEECIAAFDKCRRVLEYVLGELRVGHEEAKKFVEDMKNMDKPTPGAGEK